MNLSGENIRAIKKIPGLEIPEAAILALPEKVLQFGTGVLLRGLPDYFIDKANKRGIFNGRVVIIKSTSQGGTDDFSRQNNLYTQCIRGIDNGRQVNEAVINASVSRVLTATDQWNEVLACAENPDLRVIISNTTEVGITLVDGDNVNAAPPISFPGKLLAFLLKRFAAFHGSAAAGMVIIPTELLPGNADKLKSIVLELAAQNQLDREFLSWLKNDNDFCNSLVDRIVPGKLPGEDKAATESRLGYKDDLMIMSEVYRLWAIETSRLETRNILSFSRADAGVVLAPDISVYRELKIRLLNGSHTFTCALAVQLGFTTVKQAMEDRLFNSFISGLMFDEMVPAIVSDTITSAMATQFATEVLDRYRNPFLEHQWLSISLQYTSKMKMRNVPVLLRFAEKKGIAPRYMAMGFAAYLLFMQSEKKDNAFTGHTGSVSYTIHDDRAADLNQLWHSGNTNNFVHEVLANNTLWGTDLNDLPGFTKAVTANIGAIQQKGILQVLRETVMQ